jgi:hypothetical protein
MTDSHSGHCLCGAVHYEYSADPAVIALCHCDDCQRQSGSSFSVNVGVPCEGMTVTGEALKTYVTVGTDSGQERERKFCGECGSPLFTVLAEMPELAFIKAGTLDDRSAVLPQLEVWCERAQPWVAESEERGRFPRDLQA